MAGGQVLVAAGLLLLSCLEPGDGYLLQVFPGVVVFGFGLALTVAPPTNTAVRKALRRRGLPAVSGRGRGSGSLGDGWAANPAGQ